MPRQPTRPDALAWQVFRGTDAVRRGLLTGHQLRSSAWIRLGHDVYADARLERDHALACHAVALRLPPGAVVAGPSAAHLHGVEHAAAFTDDVHVLAPRRLRVERRRGIQVHSTSFDLPPIATGSPVAPAARPVAATGSPVAPAGSPVAPAARPVAATGPASGCDSRSWSASAPAGPPSAGRAVLPGKAAPPRTDPTSAAWETAAWVEPVRAVGIVDALLGQGLTSRDALTEMAASRADRRGGQRARTVFDLADPGAQSPPESHLRVRLVLAGLPRPVTQHPVRLPSGLVLHPDLAWPPFRVAVEYDGQWHADADQLHRDRRRLNLLVGAGWLVLHVTGRRLHHDFPAVLREVRAALAGRGWRA